VVEVHVWKMNGQTLNVGVSKSTTHTRLNVQTSTVTIYHGYTFRLEGVLKCDLIMFLKNCIFFKLIFLKIFLNYFNVLILKNKKYIILIYIF
jgi:hypothetical protein